MGPALWEAELSNVLWMATRHNVLTLEDARGRLTLAVREQLPFATFDAALLRAFRT